MLAHLAGDPVAGPSEVESIPLEGTFAAEAIRSRKSATFSPSSRSDVESRFPALIADHDAGIRSYLACH